MPRRDDDIEDDDDRPRRRPAQRDDNDDAPPRSRRPRDRDDDDPPVRSRRRNIDDDAPTRPKKKSNLGLVLGIIGGIFLVCCGGGGVVAWLFWDRIASVAGENIQNRNNLSEIGIAMHNHHDKINFFPNNTYDPQGRPLLSWRVHLLPQLGEQALYSRFNLNEPWDGPTNKPLLAQMPRVYGTPANNTAAGSGKTYYRGFSQPGAMFEKPRVPGNAMQIRIASIVDGLANTIFVVEAGDPVEWTKPDDLIWSNNAMRPSLGGPKASTDYFWVLMCDGSVVQVRKDVSDQTLRWLLDRQDGNVIPNGWRK
jgi:Protein of unknown function (DUF1559)